MADFTQEQLDEAIKKAVSAATEPLTASIKKLEANNASLVDEKKAETVKAKEAQDKAVSEATAKALKDRDFDAMNTSWQEKFDALATEKAAGEEKNATAINKLTSGAAVSKLAAEMALKGTESNFEKLIKDRIGVEMRDGDAITVVLDKDGKPSAATLDDFKKELSGDASFKPFLAGSKGSGGGDVDSSASGDDNSGNFGGSKAERTAAIAEKFPDLK